MLHALCDALLAASWRRATWAACSHRDDRHTRGIDSRELVREVMRRVDSAGLAVESVDVTILGSRPRLGGRALTPWRSSSASLLRVAARTRLGQGRDR